MKPLEGANASTMLDTWSHERMVTHGGRLLKRFGGGYKY
jgi:hypothetical protein